MRRIQSDPFVIPADNYRIHRNRTSAVGCYADKKISRSQVPVLQAIIFKFMKAVRTARMIGTLAAV